MVRREFLAFLLAFSRVSADRRPFPKAELSGSIERAGQTVKLTITGGVAPFEIRIITGNHELLASEVDQYFSVAIDPGGPDEVVFSFTARRAFRGAIHVLDRGDHEYVLELKVA